MLENKKWKDLLIIDVKENVTKVLRLPFKQCCQIITELI